MPRTPVAALALAFVFVAAAAPTPARAQATEPMDHTGHDMANMHDMEHMHHMGHGEHQLPAFLGPYSASREASGTSWVPEASPHRGLHATRGAWSLMLHGFAAEAFTTSSGPRGREDVYGASMLMGMATRPAGPGRLSFRLMVSADPIFTGKGGYPLLLQTGETADGKTPLIDRQHPHDALMELATVYSISRGASSAFLYAALAGEPALGPPVFMHRRSGEEFPDAPITHHWLDSSHITFGVLTAGVTHAGWKLEGSAFQGREPDENRWNVERPRLDSSAFRISWNPSAAWALQTSFGRLLHVEELEPDVNQDRWTASIIHDRPLAGGEWQTTLAWGRDQNRPGRTLDAGLLESTWEGPGRLTLFGRAEIAEKDELFDAGDPLAGRAFTVGRLELGGIHELARSAHVSWGLGATGSVAHVPSELHDAYDSAPVTGIVFTRLKLR